MAERIGLDNPIFSGRLRTNVRPTRSYIQRPIGPVQPRFVKDNQMVALSTPKPVIKPAAQNALLAEPAIKKQLKIKPTESDRFITLGSTNYVLPMDTPKQVAKKAGIFSPQKLITAMALLLFVSGMGMSTYNYYGNKKAVATVQAAASSSEDDSQSLANVSEDEPDQGSIRSYSVSPTAPRFVTIEKLNVFARVKRLGVTKQNQMQAPSNIFDAGWYEESSKPSDAGGAIVLDGHVSGPTKKGVFYDLKSLVAGDKIGIESGDGQKYSFKIVKTQVYDANKVDMAALLTPVTPGKLGLNIMTCTGKFDSKTQQYSQRIIAFAVKE